MSVQIYQSTRHHIAGDCKPYGHRPENITSVTLYELQNDGYRVAATRTGNCSNVEYAGYVVHNKLTNKLTNQPTKQPTN